MEVVELLSKAKKKLEEVEKEIKSGKPEADRLLALQKMKGQLMTSKGIYPQPKYIDQLNYLYGLLRRGDQLPGKDAYERFEELKKEFEQLVD